MLARVCSLAFSVSQTKLILKMCLFFTLFYSLLWSVLRLFFQFIYFLFRPAPLKVLQYLNCLFCSLQSGQHGDLQLC